MIYLKCQCGSGLGVPGSFLGECIRCDECGRTLRLAAAHEVSDGRAVRWQFRVVGCPAGSDGKDELILLGGETPVVTGSDDGCQLVLAGTLVSRAHCRLVPLNDGWMVEDVDSRHGTFVNGSRVTNHELKPGDLIDVGEWTLEYQPVGPSVKVARQPGSQRAIAAAPARQAPPLRPPAIPLATHATEAHPLSSFVATSDSGYVEPIYRNAGDASTDDTVHGFNDAYDTIELAPDPAAPVRHAPAAYGVPPNELVARRAPGTAAPGGPPCPSCSRRLGFGARICVDCGINLKTGRPLLTAHGVDEDAMHVHFQNVIRLISWVAWFGFAPVASEARGHSKPYAIWTIACVTALCSFMFYAFKVATPPGMQPRGAELMLWAGDRDAAEARAMKVQQEITQLREEQPDIPPEEQRKLDEVLAEANRPTLKFRPHQLLTHALLHNGFFHIAGNFVFLFVLGMRVNNLIGNLRTAIAYPLLAIGGGLGHLIASVNQPASPMLGASGAIMGLAGMYLVLFPAYKVHMGIWLRILRLFWTIFAVRGFWVVLFYIAFDVVDTLAGSEDGVAHWAHLGGFMTGVAIALFLLVTRSVNAYGGDLLSVVLGRYAWPLLGRPGQRHRAPVPAAVSAGAVA